MYCLAKFCCICFTRNKNILLSVNYTSKDNVQILDKIVCCVPEGVFNKIPDARICNHCRDQIYRSYNMITKTKRNLKILLGYVENLSNKNFKATGSILNVDLNGLNKKNKRQKIFSNTETNDKTELRVLLPSIEERVNSSENKSVGIKSIVQQQHFNEVYKIENIYKVEIKSESSIKTESFDIYEDEEHSLPELEVSIKENNLSPVNPNILNELLEDDEDTYSNDTLPLSKPDIFSDDTLPLTEPDILLLPEPDLDDTVPLVEAVEQNTIVEDSSNLTDQLNTTQESEKRKMPSQFPCPLCTNYFSNNAMARHLANQHNKDRFNCSKCNMTFKSEMVLKKHLVIHSADNPFDVWKFKY